MSELVLTAIVGVLLILLVIGLVVWLLVLNNTRRIRHRMEVAEMELARKRAVMQAEREARQQTMQQIGRDLHDDLGQLLTVAQIAVEHVQEDHPDPRLHEVLQTLEQSIDEVRFLGRTLNTDLWAQRAFPDVVRAELARIKRAGAAHVQLHELGEWPDLPPEAKTILFRIFQELVNNALKHARASAIEVDLHAEGGTALVVRDQGPGFDTNAPGDVNGLANIHHRCGLIGFRAHLSTAPGQGCVWRIERT